MLLFLYPFKDFELLASAYVDGGKFKERIMIHEGNITRTKTAKTKGFDSSNLKYLSKVILSDSQYINSSRLQN
jgi:hypothetical protein